MAGASPMARPISRCACAKRVSESMISSTVRPRSRKYSAIAVASHAPCRRISGGLSAGHATTTARRRPSGPEDALDEFLHFAAALADQADDDDVGAGVARHHAEQHALADAGAGEQADALAATDGQQRVDRAHADIERRVDRLARSGLMVWPSSLTRSSAWMGPSPSSGDAGAVDDAAQQARARRARCRRAGAAPRAPRARARALRPWA